MPWFRVDDNLAFHHKVVAAGNAAIGLWVRAGALCASQLTDGFVPDHMIVALGGTKQHAGRLVTVGLWDTADGGYRFHEWLERQPSKEHVESERDAARQRMAERRRKRGQFAGSSPEVRANTGRSSEDVRPPLPDPALPSPTRSSYGTTPPEGPDKPATTKRRSRLPSDFAPTEDHRRLAAELGVDLDREMAKFRDHWIGNGEVKADWNATLRNWLRNARRYGGSTAATVTRLPRADELELPPDGLSPAEYAAWELGQREKRRGR